MAARILSPVIFAWLGNVPKWNKAIYITRILARYEACHVTYQLKKSSMNLWRARLSETRNLNPFL